MSKIHRVFWTAEEERIVFSQVPELVTERWPSLWARLMQSLPVERRKSLVSSSGSSMLKQRYREWLAENKSFTPPRGSLLGKPEESLEKMATPSEPEPHIIVVERVVREEPNYGAISTSTLARILLERLALMEQFDTRFRQMEEMLLAKRLAEERHDVRLGPLPPKVEEKERAVRIVIVGPLDSQEVEIEERCRNTPKPVKLRFYDKEKLAQDPTGIVDYAIITRHCNHNWWDKMKAVLPNDRVFFVEGGVQPVVQKVFDITSRRDA